MTDEELKATFLREMANREKEGFRFTMDLYFKRSDEECVCCAVGAVIGKYVSDPDKVISNKLGVESSKIDAIESGYMGIEYKTDHPELYASVSQR